MYHFKRMWFNPILHASCQPVFLPNYHQCVNLMLRTIFLCIHLNCEYEQSQHFACRGLKIIREGDDYFLVHQGQIQRCLGSRGQEFVEEEQPCLGIMDKILFFIGDMETASSHVKRHRLL